MSTGEMKVRTGRAPKATHSGMSPGFPEAPLETHYPCAIHHFSTD